MQGEDPWAGGRSLQGQPRVRPRAEPRPGCSDFGRRDEFTRGPRCAFTFTRPQRRARVAPLVAGPGALGLADYLRLSPAGPPFRRSPTPSGRGAESHPATQLKACLWPSHRHGPCQRGSSVRPGMGGSRRAGRRFHPLERAERGAWPGRAWKLSAPSAPRRGAAELSEKFEARGSKAEESAFVRRHSCASDARLSPEPAAFRSRPL